MQSEWDEFLTTELIDHSVDKMGDFVLNWRAHILIEKGKKAEMKGHCCK